MFQLNDVSVYILDSGLIWIILTRSRLNEYIIIVRLVLVVITPTNQ